MAALKLLADRIFAAKEALRASRKIECGQRWKDSKISSAEYLQRRSLMDCSFKLQMIPSQQLAGLSSLPVCSEEKSGLGVGSPPVDVKPRCRKSSFMRRSDR
jgi:hypothetical protein